MERRSFLAALFAAAVSAQAMVSKALACAPEEPLIRPRKLKPGEILAQADIRKLQNVGPIFSGQTVSFSNGDYGARRCQNVGSPVGVVKAIQGEHVIVEFGPQTLVVKNPALPKARPIEDI